MKNNNTYSAQVESTRVTKPHILYKKIPKQLPDSVPSLEDLLATVREEDRIEETIQNRNYKFPEFHFSDK